MFYVRRRGIKRYSKTVVLFDKKSNNEVRKIRFRNSKDFEQFIEDFRLMRYPGYDWKLYEKKK